MTAPQRTSTWEKIQQQIETTRVSSSIENGDGTTFSE